MPRAGQIGAEGGGADIVERRGKRALRGGGDGGLERGDDAQALRLAKRDEPHAGRHPVGGERLKISGERRLQRKRGSNKPPHSRPTVRGDNTLAAGPPAAKLAAQSDLRARMGHHFH